MKPEDISPHGSLCKCRECRVLALFADDAGEIEAACALLTLLPLACAFLAQLDPLEGEECLVFIKETAKSMRHNHVLRIHQPAAGTA